MRKSRQETAETRDRIVTVASAKFNEGGLEKTGITDIMNAAGLTHGGFYKHFESKEQLAAESLKLGFERSALSLQSSKARASLQGLLGVYLSRLHRDDATLICPLSALGSELRNSDAELKAIASDGVKQLVAEVQQHFADLPPRKAHKKANATVAAMVGAMMLSRIVSDPPVSDAILRDTRDFLLER